MKTLKILSALIISASMFMACEKEQDKKASQHEEVNASSKKTLTSNKAMGATQAALEISCDGTCSGTDDACGMRIQGMPVEYMECDCEGCSMTFSGIADLPYDENLEVYFEVVGEDLNNHFTTNYPSQTPRISSVSIYKLTNSNVIIHVEFEEPVANSLADVSFELVFDESGSLIKKQKIECSGGCDDEGESCRERYYPGSGAVECTCQGTCAMTVTQLPTGE
ncbi:MAG: hypothetical protein RIC95_02455 [Vicingaceae bacterium]